MTCSVHADGARRSANHPLARGLLCHPALRVGSPVHLHPVNHSKNAQNEDGHMVLKWSQYLELGLELHRPEAPGLVASLVWI